MHVNYLAVLVGGVISFALGGIWYSVLFSKQWLSSVGKTEEELKKLNKPVNFFSSFVLGLITAYILAFIVMFAEANTLLNGAEVGMLCWIGFAGATSYAQYLFGGRSQKLWMIDSGYNLVTFIINGAILAVWR